MPFISLSDATFYYEALGSGPPLLYLHGFFPLRDDTINELEWLATKYRVIAPHLRGYSQSFPKPRTYPRDFYKRDAYDMKALIEALQLEPPHVLGWSDGGEVALCLAEITPLRSVAEWGAVGFYGPDMADRIKSHLPPDWIPEAARAQQGHYWEKMVEDWVAGLLEVTQTGGDISHTDAHKIDCPVLIMLGTKDTLNPIPTAQRFIDKVRDGRLEVFQEVGHWVHTDGREQFRAVLTEHLDRADHLAEATRMG